MFIRYTGNSSMFSPAQYFYRNIWFVTVSLFFCNFFSYLDKFYSSTLAILLHFFYNNAYRSHVKIF